MSDALQRITALADLMRQQQAAVERLTTELQAAKTDLERTETEDLPELMSELALTSITLSDGAVVEVKPDVHCGITEERRAAAHKWLEDHGFGGLIKTVVMVPFDREDREAATDLAVKIQEEHDRSVELKEGVHAATLKSFIKERLEVGDAIPFELFGIRPFNKAKLKLNAKVAAATKKRAGK